MNSVSPDDVRSRAFQELRTYVDTRYHGKHGEFRDMLFSIAYTKYSEEKKTRLSRLEETLTSEGKSLMSSDVKNVVIELCHDDEYRKICDAAEQILHQFGDNFSTNILTEISGVIVDQIKPKKGFIKFLKSSLIHALEIVIAAFMLAAIYEILVFISPYVDSTLAETVKKYLGKIIELITFSSDP